MRCPFCNFWDTQVKNSRPSEDGLRIKRRRFCHNCGGKFTTFEKVEAKEIIVTKRNGEKKVFEPMKLLRSLKIAARKRPISDEKLEATLASIIKKLEKYSEGEVHSKLIGQLAMNELAMIDPVSCVRYASVYLDFAILDDFINFINTIIPATHDQQL